MKNLVRTIMCLSCVFISFGTSFAQISNSQSIGVQVNPYLDSHLFNSVSIKPVYALRYTFNLKNHLSFGPELSGYYIKMLSDQNDLTVSSINLGGYVRYSFLPQSRINPFMELSPYYTFYHSKSSTIVTQKGIGQEYRDDYLTGYISPGISLVSKSHKISLDLLYKFSNKEFVNGKKSVFSYRININF